MVLRKTQVKELSLDRDSVLAHSDVDSHRGHSSTFAAFAVMLWQALRRLSYIFTTLRYNPARRD